MFKPNRNQIIAAVAVVVVAATGLLVYANSSGSSVLSFLKFGGSADTIAKQSIDYLNKNVLANGQVATLKSAKEESGVIHLQITIGGKDYDSYATKDGKLLFPEAFTVVASGATPSPSTNATADNVPKVANTKLDAYVVSDCPFGIQMQRAMAAAIKAQPALASSVNVKYIGAVSGNTITSMHGNDEAQENLRQICIRDEQPAKYWDYVSCYIQKAAGTASNGMPYGDSKTCQASTGIDTAKLNACVADPSRGLADAKKDFDAANKLNVQGSPTLILNGATISEDQFGGRSADAIRNIVCSSSSTPGAFCSTKLDTTPATTSFSLTYAAAGGATASANNACAPTVQ